MQGMQRREAMFSGCSKELDISETMDTKYDWHLNKLPEVQGK